MMQISVAYIYVVNNNTDIFSRSLLLIKYHLFDKKMSFVNTNNRLSLGQHDKP